MGIKKKYLMMVLLLMGMVIATSSCNKEEPEEIIEEKEEEIPDSEFEFHNEAKYLYKKEFKCLDYTTSQMRLINGKDYSKEFKAGTCYVNESRSINYNYLIKTFHSEEELLKSDFAQSYSNITQYVTQIDFSKQTYVVLCWCANNYLTVYRIPTDLFCKDDKYVIKFYSVDSIAHSGQSFLLVFLIDNPDVEAKKIRLVATHDNRKF